MNIVGEFFNCETENLFNGFYYMAGLHKITNTLSEQATCQNKA